jgi:hypothetical protein
MSPRDGGAVGKLGDLLRIENRKGDGMECVFDASIFALTLAAVLTSLRAR